MQKGISWALIISSKASGSKSRSIWLKCQSNICHRRVEESQPNSISWEPILAEHCTKSFRRETKKSVLDMQFVQLGKRPTHWPTLSSMCNHSQIPSGQAPQTLQRPPGGKTQCVLPKSAPHAGEAGCLPSAFFCHWRNHRPRGDPLVWCPKEGQQSACSCSSYPSNMVCIISVVQGILQHLSLILGFSQWCLVSE